MVFFTRHQPAGLPLAWGFSDRDFALQQAALLSAQCVGLYLEMTDHNVWAGL